MTQDLGEIQRLVSQGRYEFSIHAQRERLADDLDVVEIEESVAVCELLEEYPNYIPQPPRW